MSHRVSTAALVALVGLTMSTRVGAQIRSGFVDLEDARLHYRLAGEGQAFLLVHGFTNVGNVWDNFLAPIDGRMIIPDLRGHGRSSNPSGAFTHRMAAEDLLGLLDHLGVESVVGIGHSSGAIALLDLALLAPERLSAMVLIDGAHRFPEETRTVLRAVDADVMVGALPHFFGAMLRWHPGGIDQLRELARQVRAMADDRTEGVHDAESLRGLGMPTLIVHGDRDDLYPVTLAVELHDLLPESELWVMPGVDHGAFLGSQFDPEEERCIPCTAAGLQFPDVVMGFLARHRQSS